MTTTRLEALRFTFLLAVIVLLGAYTCWPAAIACGLGGFAFGCVVGWTAKDHLSRDQKEH